MSDKSRYVKFSRNRHDNVVEEKSQKKQNTLRSAKNLMMYVNNTIHFKKIPTKKEAKTLAQMLANGADPKSLLPGDYIDPKGYSRSHSEALVEAVQNLSVAVYNNLIIADDESDYKLKYAAITNAFGLLDALEGMLSTMLEMDTIKLSNPKQFAYLITDCRGKMVSWMRYIRKKYLEANPDGNANDLRWAKTPKTLAAADPGQLYQMYNEMDLGTPKKKKEG